TSRGEAISVLKSFSLVLDPAFASAPTHANSVVDGFLAWQGDHRDRPYFALLNFMDAHYVRYAPPELLERFRSSVPPGTGRYDAAIAYIDSQIDRLLGELQRRGTLDNTIVVIAADHGELLGEHGMVGHATNLYAPVLHVPLIMRFPSKLPRDQRI